MTWNTKPKMLAPIAIAVILSGAYLSSCAPVSPDIETPKRVPLEVRQLPLGVAGLILKDAGPVRATQLNITGRIFGVNREKRTGIDTENLDMMPVVEDDEDEREDTSDENVPDLNAMKGEFEFEFFDIESVRYIGYSVDRAELAKFSREQNRLPDESDPQGDRVTPEEMRLEEINLKSWSNATDNRTRRAIADGFPDTHSIYQRLADYGGCSATVLSANSTRMVAITAAHCIFTAGNNFSTAKLRPRRNGGTSPTWDSWTAYTFGYYPSFLDNDCEDSWSGSNCIKHDIALVFATPDPGATPPAGMGWGLRPKSFLDDHTKYRRGYPGCGFAHSPSGCTTNNLYGDGPLSVGSFSKSDSDGWNRQFRFSSDINPGDSGSGLYYYRDGFPYVFGVTSAEPSGCKTSCSSSRPNYGRRITPSFYDFINLFI